MVMWVLATLIDPALAGSPAHLAVGLAFVALLLVATIGLPTRVPAGAPRLRAFLRRARTAVRPRLLDPGAAGRPRPRAPAGCPAAV